ncbi:hypothetical protein G3I44_08240 [Halogeometricum borinquense]|uniref:Uncharacterized protein n=1 Tax=Halogeometricum borinquense TaxID=60847 RepID=A0A6C0UFV8_9EURY|nr:hypothetical protein G3I44_08240 [Halogeometricum borinquense]
MEAVITGETDELIGVNLRDNNGVEHVLDVRKEDGKITAHDQDAYPYQAAKQSSNEAAHLEQTHAYAKYYVQHERGYPTLEPRLTPEWIAHALGAVFALDSDDFTEYFGEYAHQYHSSLRPNIDPIVEVLEDAGGGIVFRADVFLGLDFQDYLDNPEEMDPLTHVEGITDDYDLVTALREMVTERLEAGTGPIEEVSAVDVLYQTKGFGGTVEEKTVGERTHTQNRPADAQLQMTPPQTTLEQDLSTEIIQGLVLHHLTCQVRDAYLRLGIEPPEPFRILGQGLYEQTIRYQHTDVYEPYHLTDAEIAGYRQPGFNTGAIESGALSGLSEAKTLRGLIKRVLFGR